MKSVTLKVEGMSCGHCVNSIEGSVSTLNGVDKVKVNLESSTVDVSFNDNEVTQDTIEKAIEEQGYDVAS
ncbi:copper chaperone CopZ [Alteribacillus sp. HJP-4]|uniref:copper chaperone CopZ n=1 Tax=Alteribacillus sp. HJP-4 TaxID=2775394 RepID=UPI0035CD0947